MQDRPTLFLKSFSYNHQVPLRTVCPRRVAFWAPQLISFSRPRLLEPGNFNSLFKAFEEEQDLRGNSSPHGAQRGCVQHVGAAGPARATEALPTFRSGSQGTTPPRPVPCPLYWS